MITQISVKKYKELGWKRYTIERFKFLFFIVYLLCDSFNIISYLYGRDLVGKKTQNYCHISRWRAFIHN